MTRHLEPVTEPDLAEQPTNDLTSNPEAERATLGSLLLAPGQITRLTLTADDWGRPAHAAIHAAIHDAVTHHPGTVDVHVIRGYLADAGHLTRIGGLTALHDLIHDAPAGTADYYATQVAEASTRRRLVEHARRIAQAAATSRDYDTTLDTVTEATIAAQLLTDTAITTAAPDGLHRLDDFITAHADTADDWLVPGLLARSERVMVVAGEGSGKSMWARQWAQCLAAGRHPLAPKLNLPRPLKSLIVDLENPPKIVARKTREIRAGLAQLDATADPDNIHVWSQPGGINLLRRDDQAEFERVLSIVQPDFVAFGPLYKAFIGDGSASAEETARGLATVLDRARTRHGCALWLEHHAPMEQGGQRSLRPFGSALWSRWPEFGLALRKSPDQLEKFWRVERFRGDRDERHWPDFLTWGSPLPWRAEWKPRCTPEHLRGFQ